MVLRPATVNPKPPHNDRDSFLAIATLFALLYALTLILCAGALSARF